MLSGKERIDTFEEELSWITFPRIRAWVEDCIIKFPEYFFHVGASDSNTHHPMWDLGEGGCVRHTRAVAGVAKSLCGTEFAGMTVEDKELNESKLFAAAILHDSFKYGTTFDLRSYMLHPYIPRCVLGRITGIDADVKEDIFRSVEAHMGSLRTGGWDLLPHLTKARLTADPIARLLHCSDYLGSNLDYQDPRFEGVNADIQRSDLKHYEPYADSEVRGLLLGEIERRFGVEGIIEATKNGVVDNIMNRILSLKGTYANRRNLWNYENIIDSISRNVTAYLGE